MAPNDNKDSPIGGKRRPTSDERNNLCFVKIATNYQRAVHLGHFKIATQDKVKKNKNKHLNLSFITKLCEFIVKSLNFPIFLC